MKDIIECWYCLACDSLKEHLKPDHIKKLDYKKGDYPKLIIKK